MLPNLELTDNVSLSLDRYMMVVDFYFMLGQLHAYFDRNLLSGQLLFCRNCHLALPES
jgi:hypothetical protein